jgi:hypothetical protein
MMGKQLRTPDLAYLDSLVYGIASAVTGRSARNRKCYRAAVGITGRPLSESRASRHYSGDRHSPASRVLLALEQLARGEGTTPWPLIAGCGPDLGLYHGGDSLCRARTHRAALADHQARAAAAVQRAELDLERAAINREVARREGA